MNNNFREYYLTDRYKGFYKCQEQKNSASRMTHVIFSNGRKKISASGIYTEEAMAKVFLAIDQYHLQQKAKKKRNSSPDTSLQKVVI